MRNLARDLARVALAFIVALVAPAVALAEDTQPMYRLYNPNGGEHFYTASAGERDNLKRLGWSDEGIGWVAPASSDTPVYRLYNPNGSDHHYTTKSGERNLLIAEGWQDEGVGWYSDDEMRVPLYRQYNPNAKSGSHNFTASAEENDNLVRLGWSAEGIGWYGVEGPSRPEPQKKDVASQIELIAQNQGVWEDVGSNFAAKNCGICDIDHDGLLEVISWMVQGTGYATSYHVYEVNQDGTALERREVVTTGSGKTDWLMSEYPMPTYELGGRYAYVTIDYSRAGRWSYTTWTIELILDGDNVLSTDLCSEYGERATADSDYTVSWRDASLNPISKEDFDAIVPARYEGWRKGVTSFGWISKDEWEADLIGALTSSWEGFSFQ